MTTKDHLNVSVSESIANVTLHRPDVRNAMNPELIVDLISTFKELSHRPDVRVIVLEGAGSSFCAGADINYMKAMAGFSKQDNIRDAEKLYDLFATITKTAKPVIAVVQGHAFGGGLGLVASCDIVLAETNTKFCFSEVKLGIVPAVISPFAMRKMGVSQCLALMVTGDVFTSQRAQHINLVHFVGSLAEINIERKHLITQLLMGAPSAHAKCKELIWQVEHEINGESLRTLCAQVIAEQRASPEGQEGLKSFLEKRDPKWKT